MKKSSKKTSRQKKNDAVDLTAEINQSVIREVRIDQIRQEEPFKSLFPRKESVMAGIKEEMEANGFDPAHPIVVTPEGVIVDGNCRYEVAKELNAKTVSVVAVPFDDEENAVYYAIQSQQHRRNLTDADILSVVEKMDERYKTGPSKDSQAKGKSSEKLAKSLGTSPSKVEAARRVIKSGDPEQIEAIKTGEKSIRSASKELVGNKDDKAGKRKKAKGYVNKAIELVMDHAEVVEKLGEAIKLIDALEEATAPDLDAA